MGAVRVGKQIDGSSYRLTAKDRATHMHVCGASGRGKSRFLESMIRDDILHRRGVCVIDPHGTLYQSLVKWIAMHNLQRDRTIHLIDPSIGEWTTGLNPLRIVGTSGVSARADAVIDSFAQVWGGEDTSRTPLLKKCLRAVIHVLIVHKLTLLEAMELVTAADPDQVRKYLTDELDDYVHRRLWGEFNGLNERVFSEQFMSTMNRFVEFLDSPEVRPVIGTNMQPIDFRDCMDNGDIVLVNLKKGTLSHDNARLIGTLITSDLFSYALERDERSAKRHPYYLYIDECSRFLTRSIEYMLDETRKFGLHCILSHQRLGQLRRDDETVYNAIMAGAQTKVFFGCEEDDDAEIMSRHLFRSSFDLERPVANMIKPVAVGQEPVWLDGESTTESHAEGSGASSVTTSGLTVGMSEQLDPSTGNAIGMANSTGESQGSGSAETHFSVRGWASSTQRSQSLSTIYEDMPSQNWSLERWVHEGIVRLRTLPQRKAIVHAPGRGSVEITTPFIRDPIATDTTAAQAIQTILDNSAYAVRRSEVDDELEQRHATLQAAVQRWKNRPPELLTYSDSEF